MQENAISPKPLLRDQYSCSRVLLAHCKFSPQERFLSTMASHPYPHHHCNCHPTTTSTASSAVCCCYCINYTPSHHPPVPDSYVPNHHHPRPQTHCYNPYPNGPSLNSTPPYTYQSVHHHHQYQQQTQNYPPPTDLEKELYFQQLHLNQHPRELVHNHPMVSSLLHRIAALESSLRRKSYSHSHSLRDAAARTIQIHFRAFLVRRSRTLRQLKDLASIKSALCILKSSFSDSTHFDPQVLSRKASKLLFKLDSIQGGDPMIRDGKKSISRELAGFLDFIDGVTLKRHDISTRVVKKNAVHKKFGGVYGDHRRRTVGSRDLGQNKSLEDLVSRVDALYDKVPEQDDEKDEDLECPSIPTVKRNSNSPNGVQDKVKKSVRFVENGKVYKVSRNGYRHVSNGDSDSGDDESDSVCAKGELSENCTRKAEEVRGISFKLTEDDEEDQSHDGESTKSSDHEDGSFAYSAPLPVKMESRTDMMDRRRKTLTILG